MVFKQHFYLLEEVIDKLNLRINPSSEFNRNESMIAMDRTTGKVAVSRKTKQGHTGNRGARERIK